MDFKLSAHTTDMLKEREIPEEWVQRTLDNPEWENVEKDNNVHYFRSIEERGGRILHVVVNPHVLPQKVITVFFDRRARRQK
jgi:ABC-type ATPase with predicted acetyltransferase domain